MVRRHSKSKTDKPTGDGDEPARDAHSFWGTKEELELAKALRDYKNGTATKEQVALLRTVVPPSTAAPTRNEPSGSPLEGGAPTSSSESPTSLNFDSLPDPTPEEHGEGVDSAEETAKKLDWKAYPPILEHIPNRPRERARESVLRFLTVYGPAEKRIERAPLVEVWNFDEILREAGVTSQDREILLTISQRVSQAFYTNLVSGGDGLQRYQP